MARLLHSLVVRNHLHVDDAELHCECRVGTKLVIEEYIAEMTRALEWLGESDAMGPEEKVRFFERCQLCLGRTALCLSGGGALSMYHLGVVKAMIECGSLPAIISGTSGGAIVAGIMAVHTDAQMLETIINTDVATRYPERWFPPIQQQLYSYLTDGCLVKNKDFAACTKRYYGDLTFEEAFRRTGRIVNINISAASHRGLTARGGTLNNLVGRRRK